MRRWAALGWKSKVLVVCGAYLAINLAVIAFNTRSNKPAAESADARTFSALAGRGLLPPESSAQSTPAAAAPRFRYTVTDLGTLGGGIIRATAMNNNGQVVGGAHTASGEEHAFLWQAGKGIQDLGTLGGKGKYRLRRQQRQSGRWMRPDASGPTTAPFCGRPDAGCAIFAR